MTVAQSGPAAGSAVPGPGGAPRPEVIAPGARAVGADRAWGAMVALVHDNERRREVSEALGMSFSKVRALRRLAERPMTGKELAADLLTDAPRASVLIDELVQRGLAERRTDPGDRRCRIVALTARGTAEAARADAILMRPPEQLRALPPAELATLDAILRRLAV
jgi:DNA-binding MarR family transcriptional regulator